MWDGDLRRNPFYGKRGGGCAAPVDDEGAVRLFLDGKTAVAGGLPVRTVRLHAVSGNAGSDGSSGAEAFVFRSADATGLRTVLATFVRSTAADLLCDQLSDGRDHHGTGGAFRLFRDLLRRLLSGSRNLVTYRLRLRSHGVDRSDGIEFSEGTASLLSNQGSRYRSVWRSGGYDGRLFRYGQSADGSSGKSPRLSCHPEHGAQAAAGGRGGGRYGRIALDLFLRSHRGEGNHAGDPTGGVADPRRRNCPKLPRCAGLCTG